MRILAATWFAAMSIIARIGLIISIPFYYFERTEMFPIYMGFWVVYYDEMATKALDGDL